MDQRAIIQDQDQPL